MNQTDFSDRHIGPDNAEASVLLKTLGLPDLEALADAAIPSALRAAGTGHQLDLPAAATEAEALAELRAIAGRTGRWSSMIGLGYHGTFTPAGDPAQRAGEPGLVHRVHAVPAGDLARAVWRRC